MAKRKDDDNSLGTNYDIKEIENLLAQSFGELEASAKEHKLRLKQEIFCRLYASNHEFFGNGVQSYLEAYQPKRIGNYYNVARSRASELLTSPNVLRRIDELFEAGGLNDAFVDKQLEKLLTQDADFKSKLGAIHEYNKLKQRITDKIDHTSKGKPITGITYVNNYDQADKDATPGL